MQAARLGSTALVNVLARRQHTGAHSTARSLHAFESSSGLTAVPSGDRRHSKLIAFLDDASRVCCHGEFFLLENTQTLLSALKTALYKRGVCECLYVDNGSIHSSQEITQVCQRLGAILCHTPARDGAAKGKIERFFRTVRMSFLSRQLDLSSLEALNRAFTAWVEDEYHQNENARRVNLGRREAGAQAISVYGEDLDELRRIGDRVARELGEVRGAADVKAEQVAGQPYVRVVVDRRKIARYGINGRDVLDAVGSMGGRAVGEVFEGQRRFELQVRYLKTSRPPRRPRSSPPSSACGRC